ncbi:uncharacterized protein B0I36DRAFT_343626 [Microdochium trichocladiopsis]|uniref:Uncharacterized protein n=1 Tax=Microdochium trichocladiopsis TaxID=1682393 RepID=A0A9P9BUZ9_9PEZI|nr:uncharacterized protein B0I36DRAFT_343626 [Microdochium trichocladiopsis]KAH7039778.1 hypothetical protein B0I36DRAFT_343626 [Microdochium trichocladiopsis]
MAGLGIFAEGRCPGSFYDLQEFVTQTSIPSAASGCKSPEWESTERTAGEAERLLCGAETHALGTAALASPPELAKFGFLATWALVGDPACREPSLGCGTWPFGLWGLRET